MAQRVRERAPQAQLSGYTVQEMVVRPKAHEIIVGAAVDAVFGPVILFGQGGVVDETQKAVTQAIAILGDVRESLKRVDGLLADAQAVAGNAKVATTDLATLRAEVDASLRKVASLIDEINRKWPFERDTKIKLP